MKFAEEIKRDLGVTDAQIGFLYGTALGRTAYGIIGIKVWVFKGEIMEHDPMAQERRAIDAQESGRMREGSGAKAQA